MTFKQRVKRLDEVAYFFPKDKKILLAKMLRLGLAPDGRCCMPFTGRVKPLLAVSEPDTLNITALLSAQ